MDKIVSGGEILLAQDWLMCSGIQDLKGREAGGFNAWFDLRSGQYPYVYSEITGYGITSLLFLKGFFDEDFVERAILAADWLRDKAEHKLGGVRTRHYHQDMSESDRYSFESENIYAFDNGMVLYGLINLFKKCGDRQYLEFSKRIADLLIEKMRRDDGLFCAVYNHKTGEKTDHTWKWSTQSGSYHAKLALGFTDLYDVTKDNVYRDAVLTLCRKSLDFQEPDGRFITSRADNSTHLHPHAYSAEGLLYAGMYFKRDEFILAAVKAVKWALDNQCRDGGIPKKFDGEKFITHYRVDILAQILRLGVILDGIGQLDKSYIDGLKELRSRLLTFQHLQEGLQKGGFYYGFTLEGEKRNHINSWCSMFAIQALIMFEKMDSENVDINSLRCFV